MKKIKKLLLLLFLMSIFSSGYAQTNYCATSIASTNQGGAYSVNFTCRNVGGTVYEYKLEFAVAVGIANANIAANNVNPGDVFNIGANLVLSNGNKTASVQFTSSTTPNLFVNYIAVTMVGVPGTVEWNQLPNDENFAATCGGGGGPTFGSWSIPAKIVGDADFTITPPTTNSGGAISYTSSNPAVATIVNVNQIDVHGAGTSIITLNQAADGPIAAGSTSTTLTVNAAPPSTAAPTPPARNTWDVISLYSGAYTTLTGATFQHGTNVDLAGNTTRFISNLLLARLAFPPTNISAMTTLHIDVYSLTLNPTWFELQGVRVTRNTPLNGWVSLDIPLSAFTGLNLANISFFDLNNPTGAGAPQDDMYVDNVYFYRPATTQPPTIGAFSVPAKSVGDADFVITPPTSNSAGAWSYSSSNTSVATIVNGNMIDVGTGGTSTITATQAADGTYGQGVATATFTVTFPPLTTPAPTPPVRESTDVISIYSNAYTPAPGTRNYNPNWGQATVVTNETIGADNLLKYSNLNYQGTDFGSNIDASGMTFIHIDVYSQNETSLNFFLISTNTGERSVALTPLNQGTWNSYDIPLTSYTSQAGFSLASLFQFKMVGSGGKTIYVDNMYFWKPAAEFINPTITFNDINKELGDADFTVTATSDSPGTFTYSSDNPSVATIVGNTVHIVGGGTAIITASQAASGLYNPGSATATLTVTIPPLTTAAPTPPARNDWDVISLYSEAYPTLVGATWHHGADVSLEGNTTRYLENMLLARVAFPPTNVSAMTHLHIDVYSETLSPIWFELQGNRVTKSTPVNGWVSLDIPLSEFVGLNLASVNFFDLNNPTGAVAPSDNVYVDNVYFYRPATTPPATLSDFSIPTKAYNDPDFVIPPPTSNSSGAFSYTSNNPLVATIVSGNMIHIVGGGTSTITATQAADGPYGAASITALLTVTFAPPSASPVPPARTPDRVVSMFTGNPPVYANAITPVSPGWDNATMTEVPNGTNTALQVDDFGVLGIVDQAEIRFDVSGMSHLHVDVYLNEPLNANPALSRIDFYLLANGDYLYQASNLTAGWNSLSIPMTSFPAADLTQVWGLKLVNINAATQIYLDNVYFSNECYTYYEDADSDNFGNPAVSQLGCEGIPPGYVLDNTDCNDSIAAINPGATETLYDGVDNNCNNLLDEGNQLTTTLLSSICNTTLASISSLIGITTVSSAITGYRVKVTNGTQVQIIERSVPHFSLTNLPSYEYATTYNVEIELQRNGVWLGYYGTSCSISSPAVLAEGGATQVSPSQCGIVLPRINTLIATTSLAGVTGYRFKVTNITPGAVGPNVIQTIDRTNHWFSLPMLTQYNFGSTYRIEVAIKTNGTYSGYGTPCEVSSPAAPTLINCGGVVASQSTLISATSVQGATQYRFQVTRISDNAATTIDRNNNYFTFNLVPGYTPATQYAVRVSVMTVGTWSPFGDACEITSPGAATRFSEETVPVASDSNFAAIAYPNPFTSDFNIELTGFSQERVSIKVYDMLGKLVDTRDVSTTELSATKIGAQLSPGVYNVIVSQGSFVKVQRLIKR